ncbi:MULTISPECIES: Lrp/AsnC family transcriptional regulator [Geobacillus]|uniref:Lrp/AsnC family transcriptional regulator n=1 Tax=Geobacillus thermoleovorans TaxID=33941 RepID=A0A2Z3NDI6_GEOTH|nr:MULTISPECIES: Lrp/AsnC family transcriptional regulator [Geobacillus]KFL15042.1 AsnC family transcriptional regulator [Geobacillus stearothermophilus]ADU94300.1 transcriptional regulator, AsnC family [Geobacillus sp. Y412MC52]AGE22489.1 HTH-type transcriptional regulator [Geobacillus sp. GHH01]AWO75869.1 Lrp/AsnC family transcriptional regulator [Geobacillus thermoleovorans]KFX35259.1 AsnC family transcriptional regulator [Geobacillus stearothermophilus]
MKYEIDDLDRQIIKLLSRDGRMSFTEISNNLNVTEKTVRMRYKNLIDHGILEVVGVVNPIALGIRAGAIIRLKTEANKLMDVIEQLKKIKEVRYITLTSGSYQLLIQIAVPSQDEITEVVKMLNGVHGILEMDTIVQLEVYKNTFDYI